MRKFLIILAAALMPTLVSAQEAPPISPFVRSLLEQADFGMAFADSTNATPDCRTFDAADNALDITISNIRESIDADTLITRQAESLSTMTVCARYDLLLLERKLRQIEDAVDSVANSCDLSKLKTLSFVHKYIAEGYQSVMQGGLDPSFTDLRLRAPQFWWPDQNDIDENAPACPFTTDYAPASLAQSGSSVWSYGCDADMVRFVLDQDIPSSLRSEAEQERDAKTNIFDVATRLKNQIEEFESIFRSLLREIRGGDVEPLPFNQPQNPDGHQAIVGCRASVNDEPFVIQTWNRSDLPVGLVLTPTYDSFSIYKNAFIVMREFLRFRSTIGMDRPLPPDLKQWEGVNSGATITTAFPTALLSGFLERWKQDGAERERNGAVMQAETDDALQKMMHVAEPLRGAVLKFGYVSSFPDPDTEDEVPFLATYVRDVAYFLRRSCVFGSCSFKLDNILRRALDPNCFPYGSQQDLYCAQFRCFDYQLPDECPKDKWNTHLN